MSNSAASRPPRLVTRPRSIGVFETSVTPGVPVVISMKRSIWSGWMSMKNQAGASSATRVSICRPILACDSDTVTSTDSPSPKAMTTDRTGEPGRVIADSARRAGTYDGAGSRRMTTRRNWPRAARSPIAASDPAMKVSVSLRSRVATKASAASPTSAASAAARYSGFGRPPGMLLRRRNRFAARTSSALASGQSAKRNEVIMPKPAATVSGSG